MAFLFSALGCVPFLLKADQKDCLCLPRLAKTSGNFERNALLAAYFKYVASFHIFPYTSTQFTSSAGTAVPGCVSGMFVIFLTMLLEQDTNTDMQGVRRAACSCCHFKMTGFAFEEKNVRAGGSSAAFLTVWTAARERQ